MRIAREPAARSRPSDRQEVDRRAVPLLQRPLERRHEPVAEVEDESRLLDVAHVARRELEVVRLRARGGQVLDGDGAAADLLGGVGERVERGDDALRPAAGPRFARPTTDQEAGAGQEHQQKGGTAHRPRSLAFDDNRYHYLHAARA